MENKKEFVRQCLNPLLGELGIGVREMTEKEIKKMTSRTEITFEELQEAATPLVELLRKKGHPHMTVLVTDWNVELVEALIGIPMPYDD